MATVDEIKNAISKLPREQFFRLHDWMKRKFEDEWDQQIREDAGAGRLDHLAEEALEEYGAGTTKVFPAPSTADRITFDPAVMGGKPCIRGMRVTVGTIVGLLASGHDKEKVLELYPYLEAADIDAALSFAAWRAEERELPIHA
jgi:uncharacterized protein (DUF433 family)